MLHTSRQHILFIVVYLVTSCCVAASETETSSGASTPPPPDSTVRHLLQHSTFHGVNSLIEPYTVVALSFCILCSSRLRYSICNTLTMIIILIKFNFNFFVFPGSQYHSLRALLGLIPAMKARMTARAAVSVGQTLIR